MARPQKNSESIEIRIEAEFLELLRKHSFGSLSVSQIVANAGCNRTTFYYYYDNIEDLAEKTIKKSLPEDIPKIAMTYMSGGAEHIVLSSEILLLVERLSLLIRQDGSTHIRQLIEKSFVRLWADKFVLSSDALNDDALYALEFLASGITGIIARYGYPINRDALSRSMDVINALYTEPTLSYLSKNGFIKLETNIRQSAL